MEQRRFKRFNIKLPVKLLRNGFRPLSGGGETRNMSSGGVLFATDSRIEVGEPIEYLITLSPDSPQAVNLHCLGKVLRLDESEGPQPESAHAFHIAATLERYEFLRPRA